MRSFNKSRRGGWFIDTDMVNEHAEQARQKDEQFAGKTRMEGSTAVTDYAKRRKKLDDAVESRRDEELLREVWDD
jgi:hypothetical protein